MEFHEKLQELRKRRGLTQEDVAGALFVSRTAVSKWESGRGFPSIDSLRMIARFYGVTVDELLSCDQALTIAEEDQKLRRERLLNLVSGLLDVSVLMFLFLPFFGQTVDGKILSVSLLSLDQISMGLKIAFFITVISIALLGILTLALQGCGQRLYRISMGLGAISVLLFIISPQPYAAAVLFIFLLIKVLLLVKKR